MMIDRSKVGAAEISIGLGLLVTALVGGSFLAERNVPATLLPHGVCFSWLPALLWLHVISDALIGIAYLSIPIGLGLLVRKRRDLPLNWMFVLFGVFIVSCGFTHLVGIWTIWNPDYWVAGSVKAITAAASVMTALAMIPALPRALQIPTTAQLQRANDELELEVQRRRVAEEELRRTQAELERRVEQRTRDLAEARAVSERLRLAAEDANQLKDKFLAKVSHELRTPLQAMMSWTALLDMQVEAGHPAKPAAGRISDNVRAQARLIDDLLDISRILSGKLRLDVAEVDIRDVVSRALDVVQPAAERAHVRLERLLPEVPTRLLTDAGRLEQVTWNLVNNAVQASAAGQTVRVEASVSADALTLQVVDKGAGIAEADLRRVFEPFQQVHATTSHRGLGLGLAITKSIVCLLGGSISVRSDGPGRGATFSVVLPLQMRESATSRAQELSEGDRDLLRGTRVLYVEDNEDIAAGVAAALAGTVASIDVVHNAVDALQTLSRGTVDALLSDLNLNDTVDGFSLLKRARVSGFRGAAVALSAFGEESDVQRSRVAGFSAHLVKPASADQIAAALARAIKLLST